MMRKVFGLLLALVLALAPAVSAAAHIDPGNVTTVTVSALSEATTPTRTTDSAWIDKLLAALENAQTAELIPGECVELVRLTFEPSGGECVIYEGASGCYARYSGQNYRLDAAELHRLIADMGGGFYRYRQIPKGTVSAGGKSIEAAWGKSDYRYMRLDGKFYYAVWRERNGIPKLAAPGRRLPMPQFSVAASSASARISTEGREVFSGTMEAAGNYTISKAGTYLVEITATFSSGYYGGTVEYVYEAEVSDDGGVYFAAEGTGTVPGEVVVLRAGNIPSGTKITFESDIPFTPTFFDIGGGEQIALLPVSYFVAPGSHYVKLSAGGVTQSFTVGVSEKQFQVQNLTVSAQTAEETINSQKANQEYEDVIAPLRSVKDSAKYWDGRFMLPFEGGRTTTEFGAIRYTNGSRTATRHGAVDLAAATGTTVSAANSGRVLYAGFLQLTGNTVLIEHGFGLKTWYYHMNSLNVKTDEMVKKGQKIGEVGSTGFSTGPHLHFGMSVNNVFINPYTAIETDLLTS